MRCFITQQASLKPFESCRTAPLIPCSELLRLKYLQHRSSRPGGSPARKLFLTARLLRQLEAKNFRPRPLSCGPARPATCSLELRAGLSRGERSPAARALRAARSWTAPGPLKGSPAEATAAAPTTPAAARRAGWLYQVPGSPCEAARRAQKPAGKGEGVAGCKGPRR